MSAKGKAAAPKEKFSWDALLGDLKEFFKLFKAYDSEPSLDDETVEQLNNMSTSTGMSPQEIVKALINKAKAGGLKPDEFKKLVVIIVGYGVLVANKITQARARRMSPEQLKLVKDACGKLGVDYQKKAKELKPNEPNITRVVTAFPVFAAQIMALTGRVPIGFDSECEDFSIPTGFLFPGGAALIPESQKDTMLPEYIAWGKKFNRLVRRAEIESKPEKTRAELWLKSEMDVEKFANLSYDRSYIPNEDREAFTLGNFDYAVEGAPTAGPSSAEAKEEEAEEAAS
jgi:hypothetical protein